MSELSHVQSDMRQRFIYEKNGGGRILFQQAGTEAFDGTHQPDVLINRCAG